MHCKVEISTEGNNNIKIRLAANALAFKQSKPARARLIGAATVSAAAPHFVLEQYNVSPWNQAEIICCACQRSLDLAQAQSLVHAGVNARTEHLREQNIRDVNYFYNSFS